MISFKAIAVPDYVNPSGKGQLDCLMFYLYYNSSTDVIQSAWLIPKGLIELT